MLITKGNSSFDSRYYGAGKRLSIEDDLEIRQSAHDTVKARDRRAQVMLGPSTSTVGGISIHSSTLVLMS